MTLPQVKGLFYFLLYCANIVTFSKQRQGLYGMIWNAQTLIDFDNRMTHHKQISKRYFDV